MKKKVINFNHISKELSIETINELKKLYFFYHEQAVCLQWRYKKLYKKKLILNMISIGLTVSGTVSGVLTLNPMVMGVVTGSGVMIQGYVVKTSLNDKVRDYKFAYTSYKKILTELKSYLRGLSFNEVAFLSNVKVIDDNVTDLGLCHEKMLKRYFEKYESESESMAK